jgi:hypothetical protein
VTPPESTNHDRTFRKELVIVVFVFSFEKERPKIALLEQKYKNRKWLIIYVKTSL